jgi:calcineurin-like phosphoesterase
MTGPIDSVIGVKKEIVIEKFLTQLPKRFEVETSGDLVFCGVVLEIDEISGRTRHIQRIQENCFEE